MSETSFGLRVQSLDTAQDRVLILARAVGLRNGDGWFEARDVISLFEALRIPTPSNTYAALGRLADAGLVIKSTRGRKWSVTPRGQTVALDIVGEIDPALIEGELRGTPGSLFLDALHTVIDPTFAPAKWTPAIMELLEQHPFETNVFLITRFPSGADDTHYLDPITDALPAIRSAMSAHGLKVHLASDRQLADDLLGNVAAHMWACQYGIGVLEDRLGRGLNYNVMTELGAMLMTGRRCALLKDTSAADLPSDIVGLIYKSVDLAKPNEVSKLCHLWVADDLAFGRCAKCA